MPKRSQKQPDVKEAAYSTSEAVASGNSMPKTADRMNPRAVALVRPKRKPRKAMSLAAMNKKLATTKTARLKAAETNCMTITGKNRL